MNAGAPEAMAALFVNPSDARLEADIRAIAPDGFGERNVIDIAPDRQIATARLHCTVHRERAVEPDCTLVEMARQQGGGRVRRSERMVLETVCVRRDGCWRIERLTMM